MKLGESRHDTRGLPVRFAAISALVLAMVQASPLAAAGEHEKLSRPISVGPDAIEWSPAPASLPSGAEIAVLEGDLTKQEPHTVRLRFPDGYRVAPHSHPLREHITVLKGTLMMGMGKTVETSGASALPPGAFFVLPVGDHHYVWTRGETIVQLHGIGPWGIDYVNPEDDPRNSGRN
jgi:quercetin dioxygenase-like cupin family protein